MWKQSMKERALIVLPRSKNKLDCVSPGICEDLIRVLNLRHKKVWEMKMSIFTNLVAQSCYEGVPYVIPVGYPVAFQFWVLTDVQLERFVKKAQSYEIKEGLREDNKIQGKS